MNIEDRWRVVHLRQERWVARIRASDGRGPQSLKMVDLDAGINPGAELDQSIDRPAVESTLRQRARSCVPDRLRGAKGLQEQVEPARADACDARERDPV